MRYFLNRQALDFGLQQMVRPCVVTHNLQLFKTTIKLNLHYTHFMGT